MTNRSLALIVAFAVMACRGQDQAKRSTPNYEVVSEGSASGVTSTINGPGEKPALVTDTNIDTTTNFTLPNNPNPLGNETTSTSTAGTLSPTPSYPAGPEGTTARRPALTRTSAMASSSAPIVTDTVGSTTPPMPRGTRTKPRSESDAETTTTSSDTTTTDTNTANTTTSAQPEKTSSAPKKKTDGQKKPEDQPPPTDTRG